MIRFLLLIAVIYLLYRGRKAWLDFKRSYRQTVDGSGEPARIDDVMVQDPWCQVYFPKKDGLHVRHKGEDLYFCSQECKDKYFQQQ